MITGDQIKAHLEEILLAWYHLDENEADGLQQLFVMCRPECSTDHVMISLYNGQTLTAADKRKFHVKRVNISQLLLLESAAEKLTNLTMQFNFRKLLFPCVWWAPDYVHILSHSSYEGHVYILLKLADFVLHPCRSICAGDIRQQNPEMFGLDVFSFHNSGGCLTIQIIQKKWWWSLEWGNSLIHYPLNISSDYIVIQKF